MQHTEGMQYTRKSRVDMTGSEKVIYKELCKSLKFESVLNNETNMQKNSKCSSCGKGDVIVAHVINECCKLIKKINRD